MKIEYDYKKNALIVHEIYILLRQYGYKEFIKKYDVFVNLQINHERFAYYLNQFTFPPPFINPIPTGAPGVLGLSESEISFIKTQSWNGVRWGPHFFDENKDWKKLVLKDDLAVCNLQLTNLILEHSNKGGFPYDLHFKLKEKIMDENDLFDMYGGAEGIQKDPKVLKEWVLSSLISFGKDPNFPVGMPLPMPDVIKVTEKELKGSGWIILHENAPLPNWETGKVDGRRGQVLIKMEDV